MKSIIVSLLLCALLSFSAYATQAQDTIHISMFFGSKANRIIIAIENEEVDTIAVQVRDSSPTAQWVSMKHDSGFWVALDAEHFVFPLSFNLTSEEHQNIVVSNIIHSLESTDIVDTGIQYSVPAEANAPRRHRPSQTTTTTTAPSRTTTTTHAPSKGSTTTTTTAPSKGTTTTTTTHAPSSSGSGMKLLVPLYTYPGASWTSVAAGAAKVQTVAIINPNSGPGTGPDSSYNTYMNTLHNAGVEMIGYVHTSYGARSLSDVQADISAYATEFPLLVGIFIDEAAADDSQVSYYTQVNSYIMSMPGYKYNVLNPGTPPTQSYVSISTQIVTFEDTASRFASSSTPSYANSGNKNHFAVIAYAASSSQMQSVLSSAESKGFYGWAYVTDGAAGGSTYNALASYYAQQVSYIETL